MVHYIKPNISILFAVIVASISGCNKNETRTVPSFDGVHIKYETFGSVSPAVVFIHGWSCDRRYWKEQVEAFSSSHQVVLIDLAGHGESGSGRKAWTIDSFGEDVAAVVKDLDLENTILVGHSMGGDVVVAAARHMPERVQGIVWIDTYSSLGSPRSTDQIGRFVASFKDDFKEKANKFVRGMFPADAKDSLVGWIANDMSSAPPEIALASMESSISNDSKMPGYLQQLKLPVIAINPDNGSTDTTSMNRYGVDVVVMPNVGHFMMLERPEEFNSILQNAINSLR